MKYFNDKILYALRQICTKRPGASFLKNVKEVERSLASEARRTRYFKITTRLKIHTYK